MHRSLVLATFAAASVLAAASTSQAATVLSLGGSEGCGGASCFTQNTLQRTWSARELGGGVSAISALTLDRSLLGAMQHQAVKVSFLDAAGNIVADWGAFTVSFLPGQVVTLGAYEAFQWDAAMGDLTLKLEVMGSGGRGAGGIGGGGGSGWTGRPDASAALGLGSNGLGASAGASRLNADVVLNASLAAPEPGAWALMLTGFFGAGVMLRRRTGRHLKYS